MKHKQHICIILAFFILVSNIGMAFNIRYCGDVIESVSLKTPIQGQGLEKSCCGIVEKKSHCCSDKEVKFQKKSQDFIQKNVSFQAHFLLQLSEWNPTFFLFVSNLKNGQSTSYYCHTNAPPFFKLFHKYIFYA